jgi:hypothetical protein
MRPDLALARRALVQLDRQERGIASQPATSIARNTAKVGPPRTVDPQVARTSASTTGQTLLPPLPPLPPPQPTSGARR